jgi:hypothetical protein
MTATRTPHPHRETGFTREQRERFLAPRPSDWSLQLAPGDPPVYGVLMEWPAEDATLTLVAFCDGGASVHGSHGHGIVGPHADARLRGEARALVRAAAEYHHQAAPTASFPEPMANGVRFYLLTCRGVRVLEAGLRSPGGSPDRYTGLYFRGMSIFEQLLAATGAHPDPEIESPVRQRARAAADGYVHCLFTAMALWIGSPVVIHAAAPVPDLRERVAGAVDLEEWMAAQALPYDALDARQVIRALRRAAGIHGLPFFARRGEYHILYETDRGEAVPCVFDIEVAPFDRAATVALAPADDPRVAALRRIRHESRDAGPAERG